MNPHHVHISYAFPRVKSRTGSSEEKKQEVREKDADQRRTARTGYSEEKKQDVREKNADQHRTARTRYSEEKKQELREKDADQHRTAFARLLADKAEAEAKRREDDANCPAGGEPGIVVVSDGQEPTEDGCR